MSDFDDDARRRNLLDKADQFLKRRHAQLGNPMREPAAALEAADDIPVLTEVVSAGAGSPDSVVIGAQSANGANLDAHIAREVDAWLDENLPQVIMHALDGITDRLIAEVHESARFDLLPRLRGTAANTSQENGATGGQGSETN